MVKFSTYREQVYALVIQEGFSREEVEALDCPPDSDEDALTTRCFAGDVSIEDAAFELLLQHDPFFDDLVPADYEDLEEMRRAA